MSNVSISVERGTERFCVNRSTEKAIAFSHSVIARPEHIAQAVEEIADKARKLFEAGQIDLIMVAFPVER